MTYSLAHGGEYVQGMSDLLSPLLYVMRDEAQTYVCFCALIKRSGDGTFTNIDVMSDTITNKIELLSRLLARYDPEFWSYLVRVGADQLLFVYRLRFKKNS